MRLISYDEDGCFEKCRAILVRAMLELSQMRLVFLEHRYTYFNRFTISVNLIKHFVRF